MPLPNLAVAAHHARVLAPYYFADRPASVQANPTILMLSIFGLLGGTMLALETLWRVAQRAKDEPHPFRHPVTADRLMDGLRALALLLFIGPDAVLFMAWPDVAPNTRHLLSLTNRICDFLAVAPLAAAWMLGIYGQPTVDYQLRREPIPLHLWLTWQQLRRSLWIGLLLVLMSMGLSYGR